MIGWNMNSMKHVFQLCFFFRIPKIQIPKMSSLRKKGGSKLPYVPKLRSSFQKNTCVGLPFFWLPEIFLPRTHLFVTMHSNSLGLVPKWNQSSFSGVRVYRERSTSKSLNTPWYPRRFALKSSSFGKIVVVFCSFCSKYIAMFSFKSSWIVLTYFLS